MPINSIKEHLKSVSPNCKIDPTCHSTAKRYGCGSTAWFRLLPTRKHTQRSLRCCSHAKTIFAKCLKELRDCYLKTKRKHLKHRAVHFRRIAAAVRVPQAGSGSTRSAAARHKVPLMFVGQLLIPEGFLISMNKTDPMYSLTPFHGGKSRQRALVRHPLGAGLNFPSPRHLTSEGGRTCLQRGNYCPIIQDVNLNCNRYFLLTPKWTVYYTMRTSSCG